jgi:hypothetical protein
MRYAKQFHPASRCSECIAEIKKRRAAARKWKVANMIDADNERDKREAQNRVALLAINLSRR